MPALDGPVSIAVQTVHQLRLQACIPPRIAIQFPLLTADHSPSFHLVIHLINSGKFCGMQMTSKLGIVTHSRP
jgi:hypothetical protein